MMLLRIWLLGLFLLQFSPALAQANGNQTGTTQVQSRIAEARAKLAEDPQAALVQLKAIETSLATSKAVDARNQRIEVITAQAQALLRLRQIDDAATVMMRAESLTHNGPVPTRLLADLWLAKGQISFRQSKVGSALLSLQTSHNLYKRIDDRRGQSVALQSLANLYLQSGDEESALKYSQSAIEVYSGDAKLQFNAYNNIGNALLSMAVDQKSPTLASQAAEAFRAAMKAAELSSVVQYRYLATANLARALIVEGRLPDADQRAAALLQSSAPADARSEVWHLWQVRAAVAFQQRRLDDALIYADRALAGVDPKTSPAIYRLMHQTAYNIYRAKGREYDALVQLEAMARIDKETTELTTRTANALMGARFNNANQLARIAELKAEQAQAAARAQRTMFMIVGAGGIVVLVMLGIGLVMITRSRNAERAAKIVLEKTNRELERANAAKMEFLATTSHEIRTPLNGILGMTQVLLSDRTLDPLLRDRIGVVNSAGTSMRALVDDILDMAKIETGNLTVENGVVELRAVLRDVAQVWRLQAESAGIALSLELAECPARIEGDPTRLRQIVFNLLSNAMKFTERGAVVVSARQQGDRLLIQVKDTGIGISREYHESIFELFKQVDGKTTRKYGGTGLGLAICRNLARAMEGDIRVDSEPGFGSTFTVDLPLVHADGDDQRETMPGDRNGLLIVEHNPLAVGRLRAVLAPRIAFIATAATVEEFEDQIIGHAFEWVFADHDSVSALPGGIDYFAGAVRRSGAQLVLTAPEGTGDIDSVRMLRKPVTKAMLVSAFDDEPVAPQPIVAAS